MSAAVRSRGSGATRTVTAAAVASISTVAALATLLATPPPAAAFTAASCSGDGPVVETRIAAGGTLTIFGSYTDWADPGTVVATFRGPGGRTRAATAGNGPDGTYLIDERFGAAELGTWTVTVTLSETAGSVVCTDRFTVALATPPTDTLPTPEPKPWLALVALLGGLLGLRRSRGRRTT